MKKILITGGAGYIGSVLTRLLLKKGYFVRVIDNLSFGGESIIELLNEDNFEFIKGDIRNENDVKEVLKDISYVAHLAAIVGDPACAKNPSLAWEINFESSKKLYQFCNNFKVEKFVFASTCSNYGKMKDSNTVLNEESKLSPISVYAESKVATEKYLLNDSNSTYTKPTCLRFSTVYGLSPRIRFDLTVNEFTKELALRRELIVFGEQFWRPYCHVLDLARSVSLVFESADSKSAFNVFNVGDTKENYQKQMLVNEIVKKIPGSKVKYVKKNEDPRDYKVSFEKIKSKLGFFITKSVPDGIDQIIKVINEGFLKNPDDAKYKNV